MIPGMIILIIHIIAGGLYCLAVSLLSYFIRQYTYSKNILHEVQKKYKEVHKKNSILDNYGKKKTIFFFHLTREVRNHLALLYMCIFAYTKSVKNKVTPELKTMQYTIHTVSRDIINVLDIEKIKMGSFLYDHSGVVNVSSALDRLVRLYKGIVDNHNITLTYNPPEIPLFIRIDPGAFTRIIHNLFHNALHNIRDRGIIHISLGPGITGVDVTIKDNGSRGTKNSLCNQYLSHTHSWDKSHYQGRMDSGLSIVHHIIRRVNGSIHTRRVPGQGNCSTVSFPRCDGEGLTGTPINLETIPFMQIEHPPLVHPVYDPAKYTLFVIEENPTLLSYIGKCMHKDFNMYHTGNSIKIVETLKEIPKPDIIIAHLCMDNRDETTAFYDILEQDPYCTIPVFLLTSGASSEQNMEALRRGVIDCLSLPLDIDELIGKIMSLLINRERLRHSFIAKMEKQISSFLRKTGDDEFLSFEKHCSCYQISPREKAVLREVLNGLQTKEIADKLFVSTHTVKKHIHNMFVKCKVQNRVELVNCFKK